MLSQRGSNTILAVGVERKLQQLSLFTLALGGFLPFDAPLFNDVT